MILRNDKMIDLYSMIFWSWFAYDVSWHSNGLKFVIWRGANLTCILDKRDVMMRTTRQEINFFASEPSDVWVVVTLDATQCLACISLLHTLRRIFSYFIVVVVVVLVNHQIFKNS